jgi:thymidine phosphorylase
MLAASIMSKKIAEGTGALVLDVKFGSGAFRAARTDAEELARVMVEIGTAAGVRTSALVTAMHTPLGRAVGNALEVAEAREILAGGGPADMIGLTCALAEEALAAVGIHDSDPRERLADGRAMDSYRAMIAAQGGDADAALPRASHVEEVVAPAAGRIRWDALGVGRASWLSGAGRSAPGEAVDPAAGVLLRRVEGEQVQGGEVIAHVFADDPGRIPAAVSELEGALELDNDLPARGPAGAVVERLRGW